ncbi:MAG: DMT family transporter [Acetobacteraceae bacterium]|nr:DMT family transporter [Acetobacteraceae bacterium]
MTRSLLVGLLLGVSATTIWGVYAVVSRAAILEGFQPLDIVALRYAAAAAALAPFAWRARAAIAAVGWRRLTVLALAGGIPNSLFYAAAVVYAPASHAGTIPPITVAVVGTLIAIPILREAPTRGRIAALAVMAAGVALMGLDGFTGHFPGAWKGDLLLVCAGITWSFFTILLRAWQVPAIPAVAAVTILSSVLLPLWAPFRLPILLEMPWQSIAFQAVAQGVVVGAFSVFLYAKAAEKLGATKAAALPVLGPVVAVLSAWLVLGEPLGPAVLLGLLLAVGGMLAAVLFTGRRQIQG